jgi:hypothetical protein
MNNKITQFDVVKIQPCVAKESRIEELDCTFHLCLKGTAIKYLIKRG